MKAVILAAGKGKRMRPLTNDYPKCMLPVAGVPILEWNIKLLRDDLNITDIVIVVGYEKTKIIDYFKDGQEFGVDINYIHQDLNNVYGLGAALLLVSHEIKSDFVLVLGDNMYKGPFKKVLELHRSYGADATLHIEEVDDPTRYGVVILSKSNENRILGLIEKPEQPPSNKVITGFYVLSEKVFSYLKKLQPSARGEIELTDALHLMAKEQNVYGKLLDGWRKDFGYPEDLFIAIKWYFSHSGSIIKSDLMGDVKIITPVFIGKNCKIQNSTIGPFASIGNGVSISNAEINHSVVLDNTEVIDEILVGEVRTPSHSISIDSKP